MTAAYQSFLWLAGVWRLERQMNHIITQKCLGTVTGKVTITPIETQKNHLHYIEKGYLYQSSETARAITRDYHFHYYAELDELRIYLKPGMEPKDLFLVLEFIKPSIHTIGTPAKAQYRCNEDHYEAHYLFRPNRILVTFRVTGPRKNYMIHTSLFRISTSAEVS